MQASSLVPAPQANLRRIDRLMGKNGIRARHKRRFNAPTDSRHYVPVADKQLTRNLTPAALN